MTEQALAVYRQALSEHERIPKPFNSRTWVADRASITEAIGSLEKQLGQ